MKWTIAQNKIHSIVVSGINPNAPVVIHCKETHFFHTYMKERDKPKEVPNNFEHFHSPENYGTLPTINRNNLTHLLSNFIADNNGVIEGWSKAQERSA